MLIDVRKEQRRHKSMDREKLSTILNELSDNIQNLLGEKLDKIVLYGSCARGDNTQESDVDVLVMTVLSQQENRKFRHELNLIFSRVGLKYDALLSMFLIDKASYESWIDVNPFYQNIEKDGIIIYAA